MDTKMIKQTTKSEQVTGTRQHLEIARSMRVVAVGLSLVLAASLGRAGHAQTNTSNAQPTNQEVEGEVKLIVNGTEATDDDVMPVGGTASITATLTGSATQDMTVVFAHKQTDSSNAGSLSLSDASSDGTKTLTLSKDGTPVTFNVSASTGSQAVGDAKVEAHKDTLAGTVKGTAAMTAYHFENPKMKVTAPAKLDPVKEGKGYWTQGDEAGLNGSLKHNNGDAVKLYAEVTLTPPGTPTTAAPLKDLKIAIVQNVSAGSHHTATWNRPVWTDAIPNDRLHGEPLRTVTSKIESQTNDVEPTQNGPTYWTLAELATGNLTSGDTPEMTAPIERLRQDKKTDGGKAATIRYRLLSLEISDSFMDWCALYNTATGATNPSAATKALVQTNWSLNASGDTPGAEALPETDQSHAVTTAPVVTSDKTKFARAVKPSEPVYSGTPKEISPPQTTP